MDSVACPVCDTVNPSNAMNCRQCRINIEFARQNPAEVERIKADRMDWVNTTGIEPLEPVTPSILTGPTSQERPGCVTAAGIVMGLSAIPPGLKGLVLIAGSLSSHIGAYVLPLTFYCGDVVLSIVLAWGLWHLKNWARVIVIIALSLTVLAGFVLAGFGGIILLLLFGYIIYWFVSHGEYFQ